MAYDEIRYVVPGACEPREYEPHGGIYSLYHSLLSFTISHHHLPTIITNGALLKLASAIPHHSHNRLPWNLLSDNSTGN